jgi:hypothetical protein
MVMAHAVGMELLPKWVWSTLDRFVNLWHDPRTRHEHDKKIWGFGLSGSGHNRVNPIMTRS